MYTLQLGTIYTNHNSFSPGGSIPHNMACSLTAPPTLLRSDSNHYWAALSSLYFTKASLNICKAL